MVSSADNGLGGDRRNRVDFWPSEAQATAAPSAPAARHPGVPGRTVGVARVNFRPNNGRSARTRWLDGGEKIMRFYPVVEDGLSPRL